MLLLDMRVALLDISTGELLRPREGMTSEAELSNVKLPSSVDVTIGAVGCATVVIYSESVILAGSSSLEISTKLITLVAIEDIGEELVSSILWMKLSSEAGKDCVVGFNELLADTAVSSSKVVKVGLVIEVLAEVNDSASDDMLSEMEGAEALRVSDNDCLVEPNELVADPVVSSSNVVKVALMVGIPGEVSDWASDVVLSGMTEVDVSRISDNNCSVEEDILVANEAVPSSKLVAKISLVSISTVVDA
jgi:hypothetical protein